MTDMNFVEPAAPSSGINWDNLHGELLLLAPVSIQRKVKTTLGEKDAIRCAIDVLTGDLAGTSYPDALVFPKVLVAQLGQQLGLNVLARLGKGDPKPNQSAPWKLLGRKDGDLDLARAHVERRAEDDEPEFGFTA